MKRKFMKFNSGHDIFSLRIELNVFTNKIIKDFDKYSISNIDFRRVGLKIFYFLVES